MIYYADKFNVYTLPLPDKEYEVLNELKTAHRSDDNCLYHTRFLFESDSLPIEEQWKYAKRHENNIMRVTFSGKKSIHVILEFPKEKETFCYENYKLIWKFLNDYLFDGNCDKACANPSRLTRRPGVIRADTGKKQILLLSPEKYISEELFEQCNNYITEKKLTMQKRSELVRRYRKYMATSDKVDCSKWNVIKRYLETPFPHMTGNGNSSSWLYAALQTCKQYGDNDTMETVILKAKSEGWTDHEIMNKLK